jgi:hypothetical protein
MTQFVDVADVIDGDTRQGCVADDEPQWIVLKAADISTEFEWATMELISFSIMS